jgi:hypothetical protein
MKVAFQAGVLQVLLDEAGVAFDHVDAASGGVFNAALLSQGLSGTEIADCWRRFHPVRGAALNWRHPLASVFTMDRFRRNVLRDDWGLDWARIRATPLDVRFNVFDVAAQRNRVVPAKAMTEDLLVAAVALPMWFPPVVIDGQPHIDSVFVTDANLDEVVEAGADEVWVIWTVSRDGNWRSGFLNQYFQVIEAAANGRYADELRRHDGVGGVKVVELGEEVALNYLVNFSNARFAEAVEQGVRYAREWCDRDGAVLGVKRRPPARAGIAATPAAERVSLSFREPFGGRLAFGADDPDTADVHAPDAFDLRVALAVTVPDIAVFLASPDHEMAAGGTVQCDALGGALAVAPGGGVRLNTDVDGQPGEKRMTYRLEFGEAAGHPLTLHAVKVVRNDEGFDLWKDTTTFRTRLLRGSVGWDRLDDPDVEVVAAGLLSISLAQFTRSLLTYRPKGPSAAKAAAGQIAFFRSFVGKLWDVYASKLSTYSPF